MSDEVTVGAHHAVLMAGSRGWWEGVMRHWHADVWTCGHQHEDRKRATACATKALLTAQGVIHEPISWRPGAKGARRK
jgi:hypothetical protein